MASPFPMSALFFVFVFALQLSIAYESCSQEVAALITFKNALVDPHGVMNDWDEFSVDPCSWSMISCSPDNIVVGLGAPSQHLSGTLSPAIANLTNIRQILLQNNNISGKIPYELTSLSMLQTLDLSNNTFFNSLPHSFSRLRKLQYLRLNNNSFSGPFPASLAELPQLSFLDLSFNNLSGPVPSIQAKTFNVAGNPLICTADLDNCYSQQETLPFPITIAQSPGKNKLWIALGASAGAIFFILIIAGTAWNIVRTRSPSVLNISDQEDGDIPKLRNLRNFTFRELHHASENFAHKNLLGAGGFGNVYRGKLKDGTVIAVKRLNDVSGTSGDSQFRTELEMISLAVHRNLLRLIGFCSSANEKLLVYPFMSNGSLAHRLRVKPALDWETRKRIAVGAARGLVYLHDQCDPKIIHRDVKAANILLDDDYEAVVGDFGLAKLLDHADSHVTTAVRGTVGHIAPEYLSTGQSSEKTDVFGFGILMMELVSGMRTLDMAKFAGQKGAVVDWVKRMEEGIRLEEVVDKGMCGKYDEVEVREMLQVALLCTQHVPAHRPKMCEVLRILEGDALSSKWLPSHCHVPHFQKACSVKHGEYVAGSGVGSVSAEDDDDDQTLHSYAMELSGPR